MDQRGIYYSLYQLQHHGQIGDEGLEVAGGVRQEGS